MCNKNKFYFIHIMLTFDDDGKELCQVTKCQGKYQGYSFNWANTYLADIKII